VSTGEWQQIKELFEACLERDAAERARLLNANAPISAAVRAEVEALLAAHATAGTMGHGAAAWCAPLYAADASEADAMPPAIGPYRVLRMLGRGGMGVVYLAQQEQPRRLVAIKLIASQHDAALLARFRREADALARLSHPGIAQVFDVGSDQGRPYLVMEFVDGAALAHHAQPLTRAQRLELVARIADAIDHAHSRNVVHRDLKPSNILIDAAGQPKILDFGIALLNEVGGESLTATGMLLGTPAYMSPEQALGEHIVDSRSDVYALGVLAYELLADRLPLPVAGLTPLQALRVVGEHTPPPLSRIDRRLRGDLETIVEKALAKERSLRYANAGAFADDVRRYLANEPIQARRPGALRRATLFVRRHRALSAALALAAAALFCGTALALYQRGQALQRAAEARASRDFILRVFTGANRWNTGRETTALELAQRGFAEVATQLKDQPRAQVEIYGTLAEVFARNQPMALAVEANRRKVALMDSTPGYSIHERIAAHRDYANTVGWSDDYRGALRIIEQMRSTYADDLAHFPDLVASLDAFETNVLYYLQRYAQFRQFATPEREAAQRPYIYAQARSYFWLFHALADFQEGRMAALPDKVRSLLDAAQRDLAVGDVNRPAFAAFAAPLLLQLAPGDDTRELLERALTWERAFFGPDSTYVLQLEQVQFIALRSQGADRAAEALFRRLEAERLKFPAESNSDLQLLHYYGGLLALARDDVETARQRFTQARAEAVKLDDEDSAPTRAADAALLALRAPRDAQAAQDLEKLAQLQIARDDAQAWRSRTWLGAAALQRGDGNAARAQLSEANALVAAHGGRAEPEFAALCARVGVTPAPPPAALLSEIVAHAHRLLDEGDGLLVKRRAEAAADPAQMHADVHP